MEEEQKNLIPYLTPKNLFMENQMNVTVPNKKIELPKTIVQKPDLLQYDQLLSGVVL